MLREVFRPSATAIDEQIVKTLPDNAMKILTVSCIRPNVPRRISKGLQGNPEKPVSLVEESAG